MPRSRSPAPRGRTRSRSPPRRDRDRDDYYRGGDRGGGRRDDYQRDDRRRDTRDTGRRDDAREEQPARTSLLVRNIPKTSRPDELRRMFERYGPVRDVYLPKDYYTGEVRGFAFVQMDDGRDAMDAQRGVDRTNFGGRDISCEFAKEERKRPEQMRASEKVRGYSGPGGSPREGRGDEDRGTKRRSPSYDGRGGKRESSPGRRRSPSPKREPPAEEDAPAAGGD